MKHLVVVLTEPSQDREKEYNEYYEDIHLDEVIETTGWKTAQRFKLGAQAGQTCPLPYLAIYEAQADSSQEVLDKLEKTRSLRRQSGSLNMETAAVWVFGEIGSEHT